MIDHLEQPLLFYRYDYCFKCSTPAIESYDFFNKEMGYNRMVTAKLNGYDWKKQLNNRTIFSMRCKSCGEEYGIGFIEDGFPVPNPKTNFSTEVFYKSFKEDGYNFFKDKRLDLSKL